MNNNGYIIIGFPGVGKSTVAKGDTRFIDLESSTFMVDGQRSEDWYKIYVNVAIDLAKQYNVFISSHMAVQNYLVTLNYNNVIMAYPDKSLKRAITMVIDLKDPTKNVLIKDIITDENGRMHRPSFYTTLSYKFDIVNELDLIIRNTIRKYLQYLVSKLEG